MKRATAEIGKAVSLCLKNSYAPNCQVARCITVAAGRQKHTWARGHPSAPHTRAPPQRLALPLAHLRRTHTATSGSLASLVTQTETDRVSLQWQEDGTKSTFNATWLRYNCQCAQCIQAASGQKVYNVANMLPQYSISSAFCKDGKLHLEWEEDNHVGEISLSFLKANDVSEESRRAAAHARTPMYLEKGFPEMHYEDIVGSKQGLLRWMRHTGDYGACWVKGVPTEDKMVKKMGDMIWPVLNTIYGETFEVISTPTPINVAYSDAYLPFHMDLAYYESPPGLQLLHCLRNDACVTGGENLLVDSFYVAEQMRELYPQEFETLLRVPATFEKIHFEREKPVSMRYQRPHIVLNPHGDLIQVNWSPAFEGPLFVSEEDVDPYYKAYNTFAKMLETSDKVVSQPFDAGDLICFNNRRVLHGRNSFVLNGGMRHLQGAYVNIDEFKSQLEVLNTQIGDKTQARRVGNMDFF